MSIDLNWETITSGPDGEALSHRIRDFVHEKFQAVKLPRFIKSVTVHDFEFGSIAPQLELKDITDPLPDFYEDNEDYDDEDGDDAEHPDEADELRSVGGAGTPGKRRQQELQRELAAASAIPSRLQTASPLRAGPGISTPGDMTSPFLGVSTPGFLGGASNLHYFQSHLGTGWSGTQTPLAAVAGAHMGNSGWLEHGSGTSSPFYPPSPFGREGVLGGGASPSHSRNPSQSSISVGDFNPALAALTPNSQQGQGQGQGLREKLSVSTLAPTSVSTSRPPTRDPSNLAAAAAASGSAIEEEDDEEHDGPAPGHHRASSEHPHPPRFREPRPEDMQAVFRIRYAGDIKLRLTAEILLDYPMPSFVGIPVQLSVTGLTFDGVGVLAHIRKRLHFCFLSPEDALTAVGLPQKDEEEEQQEGEGAGKRRFGGLLQEIQVESEIGLRESGKQSLKNVGKVERFVLEQVRRIFEDEFVYPSFWTFLV